MSLKQALTHSCLFNTSNTYSEGRSQLCIIIPTQYNPTSKDSHSDSHRKDSSLGLNPWLKRHCMLNCIFIKCIYNRKKNHGKTSNTYSWGMDDDYSYRFGLNKTAPSFGLEEHLQNHCVVTSYTVTKQDGMTLLHNAQEASKPTFISMCVTYCSLSHTNFTAAVPHHPAPDCCNTPARRSRGLLLTVSVSQVQPQLHWSCTCAGCQETFKQNIMLLAYCWTVVSTVVPLSFSSVCFSPSVPFHTTSQQS